MSYQRHSYKSKPRKQLLRQKPGWLKVCWGRLEGEPPDIVYIYGGEGAGKRTGHLMHALLNPWVQPPVSEHGDSIIRDSMGRQDFAATLDAAGFDLSTLEIRIKMRSKEEQ